MAAAIGRVQGQAGALGSQIQGLRRDSAALIGDLQRVDAQARAAADTLMRYRRTIETGSALPEKGWADTASLKQFIIDRTAAAGAPDVGRAFVTQFENELGASLPRRPVAAPAGDGPRIVRPATPGSPAPGTKPATLPPPAPGTPPPPTSPPVTPTTPVATPQPEPARRKAADVLGDPSPPPWPAGAPRRKAAEVIEARRAIDAQFRADGDEQLNLTNLKRRDLVTDSALQRSWREGTRTLRDHTKELQQAQVELRRYEAYQQQGVLYPNEAVAVERLRTRVGALRDAIQETSGRQTQIATEWERRGYSVRGDALSMARRPPGPLRTFMGGLGGGLGGGGGSVLGAGMGLLAGTLTPAGIAASLGLAIGAFGARSAETYEDTQRLIFDTGMRLGGGFGGLRRTAMGGLRGPLHLQFRESVGAVMALAMQTGQTDAGSVAAFARAYGLPVEATAQIIGQMGALGVMPRTRTERTVLPMPPRRGLETTPAAVMPAAAPRQEGLPSVGELVSELASKAWSVIAAGPGTAHSSDEVVALMRSRGAQAAALDPRAQARARFAELRERLHAERDPQNRRALREAMRRQWGRMTHRDVVERTVGRGLPEMIAGAYAASPYRGNNALMSAFLEQSGRLMQVQAAGGAPIIDFERMPAMLSAATRAYGADVNPAFGARLAGGVVQGIQQPQGDVLRGVALRAVMQLGRTLSPEQLAAFQNDPKIRQMTGGVGIDLRSYTGAQAAMQNAFSLPREQAQQVIRAIASSYRGLVGSGTEASRLFFTQMFGGKAALGIAGEHLFEQLLSAEGGRGGGDLVGQFKDLLGQAGGEGAPFLNDARITEVQTTVGAPLKQLGQGITEAVLDFADQIRDAQRVWEGGVPASQNSSSVLGP